MHGTPTGAFAVRYDGWKVTGGPVCQAVGATACTCTGTECKCVWRGVDVRVTVIGGVPQCMGDTATGTGVTARRTGVTLLFGVVAKLARGVTTRGSAPQGLSNVLCVEALRRNTEVSPVVGSPRAPERQDSSVRVTEALRCMKRLDCAGSCMPLLSWGTTIRAQLPPELALDLPGVVAANLA